MRRRISLTLGAMLLMVTALFGKTSVLIDFDLLKANGNGDPAQSVEKGTIPYNEHYIDRAYKVDQETNEKVFINQHMPTLVDYSGVAGSNFKDDEKALMKVSLSANNWDIVINSSANSVKNRGNSKTIEWHTNYVPVLKPLVTAEEGEAEGEAPAEGGADGDAEGFTVLGVRVHFPLSTFNNWALIKPPFEIPAYDEIWTDELGNVKAEYQEQLQADENGGMIFDSSILTEEDKGDKFLNGYGVIRNVADIKTIDLRVYGCQFKNSISILLKDENEIVTEYHMPQYLDFDGWRQITWSNPNYITNAANRDLYVVPLYPRAIPYIKLQGFRVYRQGDQLGGDFVTYVKDVHVTYDEAVLERENPVIEHEKAWGILSARTQEAKKREFSKIGHVQILRFLEQKKMHRTE